MNPGFGNVKCYLSGREETQGTMGNRKVLAWDSQSWGSGTRPVNQCWIFSYSGILQDERPLADVGIFTRPWLECGEQAPYYNSRVLINMHHKTRGQRLQIKREAELSANRHLVVSWIRCLEWRRDSWFTSPFMPISSPVVMGYEETLTEQGHKYKWVVGISHAMCYTA